MQETKMQETKQFHELYVLIYDARRGCASGSYSIQPPKIVVEKIEYAIVKAEAIGIQEHTIQKLRDAKNIMLEVENYYDRLPADDLLCEVLNVDLKGYR